MAKETGTLDLNVLKVAASKATGFITEITNDGINIHEASNDTTYVKIKSGLIEMVRSGVSMLKMWVDTTTKMRLGDPSGKHIAIDSSSGVAVMDGSDEVAGFGSTVHIGKVANSSRYLSIDSSGNGAFHGAKLDIFDYPHDVATDTTKGTIRHHYVKVANLDQNGNNYHAVSLYASSDSSNIGIWDEVNSCWVIYANYQDAPSGTYQRIYLPGRIFLANGTQIWDNTSQVTHLLTPVNSSNKQAEFTFEPDGKIYHRTSTNGGTSWSSWTSIAG